MIHLFIVAKAALDPSSIPTQLLPLRKCVPNTVQVRPKCGQPVMVPHITKVRWCQHNHVVCTVTTSPRAAPLDFSLPVYEALCVRKMNDGTAFPLSCQMCLNDPHWVVSHTLSNTRSVQSFMVTSWWIFSSKQAEFRPPTKCTHRRHKTKMVTKHHPIQLETCTKEM